MVGALADWFAVVALFRRVPVPFISRHTAIIPRNKDRIGENLGRFVQEKFLDTPSLLQLIRRHDPAQIVANWLSVPANAERVGYHLLQLMRGFLDLTDDARIQRFMRKAVHAAIDKVDLTQSGAMILESLTKTIAIRRCWMPRWNSCWRCLTGPVRVNRLPGKLSAG